MSMRRLGALLAGAAVLLAGMCWALVRWLHPVGFGLVICLMAGCLGPSIERGISAAGSDLRAGMSEAAEAAVDRVADRLDQRIQAVEEGQAGPTDILLGNGGLAALYLAWKLVAHRRHRGARDRGGDA